MALDDLARDVQALYAVGVNGALCQPAGIGYLVGFGVEHLHEVATDDFTLLFRVGHALQVLEEFLRRIHADDVQPEALVVVHHVLEFVLAQQAMVHEDAGQVLPDSAVQQHGGYRRIHASAQAQNDAVVANLLFQLRHRSVYKRSRAPRLVATAGLNHKVLQHLRAVFAVKYLGVELHAPRLLALHLVGGNFHLVGRCNDFESCGNGSDGVAVAHPHLRAGAHAMKQQVIRIKRAEVRPPVLTAPGRLYLAAVGIGHELRAVADAQQGQAAAYVGEVDLKSLLVVHGEGAAGENDAPHALVAVRKLVVRHNFAIHVQLAQAAPYELGSLRTEIEDNDFFFHCIEVCCVNNQFESANVEKNTDITGIRVGKVNDNRKNL